jgi:hypothetical protein
MQEVRSQIEKAQSLGLTTEFPGQLVVKDWDGRVDQRGAAIFSQQATFHPTKYLITWSPQMACRATKLLLLCPHSNDVLQGKGSTQQVGENEHNRLPNNHLQ